MPLTDISLLFKDIIETPQQKAVRLAREGQAAAVQYTGLPTGLRQLAMGTASRIPGTVESIRQFGAGVGLLVSDCRFKPRANNCKGQWVDLI